MMKTCYQCLNKLQHVKINSTREENTHWAFDFWKILIVEAKKMNFLVYLLLEINCIYMQLKEESVINNNKGCVIESFWH